MKKVSEILQEAKRVLVHYRSWIRKCGGRNRRGRTATREAYCECPRGELHLLLLLPRPPREAFAR